MIGAKPLAIDLFCGLVSGESKLCLCADASIQQFVTRRAENPDHAGKGIFDLPASSVSFMCSAVSKFNYTAFPQT